MASKALHIAILAPPGIVREGMLSLLRELTFPTRLVIIEADAFRPAEISGIHCMLIDSSLVMNRMKEFSTIRRSMPDMPWIGLISSPTDHQIHNLFDYQILLYDSPERISQICQKIATDLPSAETAGATENLTERETEVLKQIVRGCSQKEIADKLNISIHTVVTHRKNISQKTGIKTQSGLTIYALTNRIISLEDFPAGFPHP